MRAGLILLFMVLMGASASAQFCVSAHRFDIRALGSLSPRMNAARLQAGVFHVTEFRRLQEDWLRDVTPLGARQDLFRATIQGHAVIAKRAVNLKEAAWLQELNAVGLGPKLHGLVEKGDALFVVMADVGGVNTQVPMLAPAGFKLSASAVAEMKRQLGVLLENGVYPFDIQFQVSADGRRVVLIDPEMFHMRAPGAELDRQGRMALETVLLNWRLEGRVED